MIKLDYSNIFNYSQDTSEYLFMESAEIEPGKHGKAKKHLSMQDWFFRIHFPGNPIMPGTLMMESVMELGTLVISTLPQKEKKLIEFYSCEKAVVSGEGRPGNTLLISTVLLLYRRGIASFEGNITIKDKEILRMRYTLIVPDEIIKIPESTGGGHALGNSLQAFTGVIYNALFCSQGAA